MRAAERQVAAAAAAGRGCRKEQVGVILVQLSSLDLARLFWLFGHLSMPAFHLPPAPSLSLSLPIPPL